MPADLEPVPVWPQVVGVVDHPGRQPQHLALERRQASDLVAGLRLLLGTCSAFQRLQHLQLLPRVQLIRYMCEEDESFRPRRLLAVETNLRSAMRAQRWRKPGGS